MKTNQLIKQLSTFEIRYFRKPRTNRISFWKGQKLLAVIEDDQQFAFGVDSRNLIELDYPEQRYFLGLLTIYTAYEIKSGMADFKSGNGLTFYGDSNYLVTTREFADELISKWLVPRNIDMILTPNSTGTALYPRHKVVVAGIQSYRKRPASEILWNMVQSHNRDLGGY